jgi:pyrimidine operon attenuation protein/uracil phosphoribosyltransferase
MDTLYRDDITRGADLGHQEHRDPVEVDGKTIPLVDDALHRTNDPRPRSTR